METTIHDLAIETIHARESRPGDALGACVLDALLVGTRVVPREPLPEPDCPCCATERDDGDCCCTESCPIGGTGLPEPTPLHRALIKAMVRSTTWQR